MLHHLPVLEAVPVLVPLEDVVPLASLLVPVAVAKQRIAQVGGAAVPCMSRLLADSERHTAALLETECVCVCVCCQHAAEMWEQPAERLCFNSGAHLCLTFL
jgi:hypothetical protein